MVAKKKPAAAEKEQEVSAAKTAEETAALEQKEEKKTAAKKTASAKTAEKKTPAKRTSAKEIKTELYVQYEGKEVSEKELIAAAKKAYTKFGNKVSDIKTIALYVKPEEGVAYYVINGTGPDDYKIEL